MALIRQSLLLNGGTRLAYVTAGDPSLPPVLLIHGFPSSADTFRHVIPALSEASYVVAPDMPGFGQSDVLAKPGFDAIADAIAELITHLGLGPRYIYLHDFGAPAAFRIAMAEKEKVLGLIIQNANAHRSGHGEGWEGTEAYWRDKSPENEAKATAHLTLEGTRDQYVAGVPDDIAKQISPDVWEEDWRVMSLPGRLDTQKALIADYGNYVARFPELARYIETWQPPALMLWGRHDAFFDIAETLSWMKALPRMEAHILDGGHFLLETHAAPASKLMVDFIRSRS